MDYSVFEIADGINLNCFPGSGDESFLSVNILSQLSRETVSLNAVLPRVLLKGCFSCPDEESLKSAMKTSGGMTVEPFSEKYGEVQAIGIRTVFSTSSYKQTVGLVCELLCNPSTRGGLLLPDYVKSVCDEYAEEISDSDQGSIDRCLKEMCAYEDYAISTAGCAEDVSSINYKKLSKHYKTQLQIAPIEIIYFGTANERQLVNEFKRGFSTIARTEIDYEIGTDVRLNSVEDNPRRASESTPDGIERIALGYRCGEGYFDYDFNVFKLMLKIAVNKAKNKAPDLYNDILESSDRIKGVFAVSASSAGESGTDFAELFNNVLSEMAEGRISEEELSNAARVLKKCYEKVLADPESLSNFILSSLLSGSEPDMDECIEWIGRITAGEIVSAAAGVVPDMIYSETTDI